MKLVVLKGNMIERYSNPKIKDIWSDGNKLSLWEEVEIALIRAREILGRIKKGTTEKIESILKSKTKDLAWWEKRDGEIHHDLQAAVEERRQHLGLLANEYHKDNTSYDTEEPAMAKMLEDSTLLVLEAGQTLNKAIEEKALRYRFTPMLARTHGQWAQIQSFGFECLTWHESLKIPLTSLADAEKLLRFTKCSGAIGNNAEIDPELEMCALSLLNKRPWRGATQIMPREIHAQLASSLSRLVTQCEKISLDIRLASRSGFKILEEPFTKNQKGSSAMPQKRNPIRLEQICGMGRVARHLAGMLEENIVTWESRDISQSCVERIAWPDLFHVAMRVLTVLTKVIEGLNVYPDKMMEEIVASGGTYASNAAKSFLAEKGKDYGITPEDAYGIVRLAGHIMEEPDNWVSSLRRNLNSSLELADASLISFTLKKRNQNHLPKPTIEKIIMTADIHTIEDIDVDFETAKAWGDKLFKLFNSKNKDVREAWSELFKPSRGMANEGVSFLEAFDL